ncbi:histidine phosphatase family protein [Sphingomonas histidinilytica]|jgi:phosphohistidine phosphatase|uniref:Phosphohistidine phosphatase n=1 Tax=Rhizorhabdus histidinilytica TaxID=439228 RepID=A0A1T5ALN7_9SPHN|nr:histidine phosphatase family protein [Rhizorhabdus histidinilytica]MBO9376791.1 histidine phosphatase family protein [Rhizorhabdus histidinilytica]QEH79766.1 histidine phosphatase family protein [Sphingomonas sp. C8-2]SKB35750.1 phosphohistidine phosphatase [Rhizorhabdus histidinilytica]
MPKESAGIVKKLTLLRHAKSGWDDPVARDFDRPLNGRGKRAAHRIGQYLRDHDMHFDHVVSSPAVRCVETIEHLAEGTGETIAPAWDKRVYLASAVSLLDVVQEANDQYDSLLLVGHNPGLEDLVLMLVPDRPDDAARDQVEEKFPTASIAEISFPVEHWDDVRPNGGLLSLFVRPRDLDPGLGPDQD